MKTVVLTLLLLSAVLPAPAEEVLIQLQAKPWLRVHSMKQYPTLANQSERWTRKLLSDFPGRMEKGQVASLTLIGVLGRPEGLRFLLLMACDPQKGSLLRRAAILALVGYQDRRIVLPLLDTLSESNPLLQQAAVQVLRNWVADPMVEHRVRRLMRHPQPDVRRHTLRLLAWARDPGSAGLIRRALRDKNLAVRCAAYRAAGRRRMTSTLSSLRKALGAAANPERIAAVQGLAGLGRSARPAIGQLLRLLGNRQADNHLRATIPGALAVIGTPSDRLLQGLQAQTKDPSAMVRHAIELALAALRRRKGGAR